MSLSNTTLSALQQAGAAAFTADAELKNAVRQYAERVTAAMLINPSHLGNDAMFDSWKVIARLSQTMSQIEEELRKVYHVASELIDDDQPHVLQALSAPTESTEQTGYSQNDMMPTDVQVKPRKRSSKLGTRGSKAKPGPVKRAGSSESRQELGGNAEKLLRHLEKVLNSHEFTAISQTAAAQATGIPMGSMTAASKKLIESGRIIAGPAGSFMLPKSL
jgi:hypothetical protein